MRSFLSIYSQEVPVLIKRSDTRVRPRVLVFKLGYRIPEGEKIKLKWSRHLETFNDNLFVDARDPIKHNPFDPYKKVVKLPDFRDSNCALHIILTFETQFKEEFEKHVMFCTVEGFEETFMLLTSTSARAADALLALRTLDRRTEKEVLKEAEYSTEHTLNVEAAKASQIIKRGKS